MSRNLTRKDIFSRRTVLLSGLGGLVFSGLVARLYKLQIVDGPVYDEKAIENRINLMLELAERGIILDRQGIQLAENARNHQLLLVPEQTENIQQVLTELAKILGKNEGWVARQTRKARSSPRFQPFHVADDLDWESFAKINARAPDLPGVTALIGKRRHYPFGADLAHVAGYVQKANPDEAKLDKRLRHPNARIGRYGMEQHLESKLRGADGAKRVEINAAGRIIRELPSEDTRPVPGQSVQLTIDSRLQSIMAQRLALEAAGLVLLDLNNGDILCQLSTPSFDPNPFVQGYPLRAYNALRNSKYKPLYDKALKGGFPAASTFKMAVALAALEAGISPQTKYHCNSKLHVAGRTWNCWKRHGHGTLSMRNAIKQSCDVYFYHLGRRVGPTAIAKAAQKLGLGQKFDRSIGYQISGNLPSPAWKEEKYGQPWWEGDTLNLSIGQGELLSTPLQLAVMTARLATGREIEPRLILPPSNKTELRGQKLKFTAENMAMIRDAMWAVSNEWGGTARSSGDLGIGKLTMAGKTGTAQAREISESERRRGIRKNDELPWELRDHSLFVGFAPYDRPRYAAAAIVEHGGGGSKKAAPIVRDALASAIRLSSGDAIRLDQGTAGKTGPDETADIGSNLTPNRL